MKQHPLSIKSLVVSILILLLPSHGHADILRGRVIDSETKEPLQGASVEGEFKRENMTWIHRTATDSLGYFLMKASASGSIKASMLGYYPKSIRAMVFSDSERDTTDVGVIELKMSEKMMQALEVKARARRFTVRGDTIVFHPEAFHLQEGARLDELIRQLPGVEVADDGSLRWNGKPIRITMDGESLFGGSDLVKTLPAEAVENIKAYNKASEFSERTRKDDGKEDMVLDLTIKPGFLDRWYGDVTAGYQTPKHYDAGLTMRRLSKTDPVMIAADANNTNAMWRRYMGSSQGRLGRGNGQEQGASAGYQHNWQRKHGTHDLKSLYNVTGGLAHDDQWSTTRSQTDNYFPDAADTHIDEEDYQRSHLLNPYFATNLHWARDSMNTWFLNAKLDHKQQRATNRQEMNESTGFSQLTSSRSSGHTTDLDLTARWNHYVKDGALGANATIRYTDGESDSQTLRTITTPTLPYSTLSQASHAPSSTLTAKGETHFKRWLTKNWLLETVYNILYQHDLSTCDFLTDNLYDAANSYSNRYNTLTHSLNLASTLNLQPLQLMPRLSAQWKNESQDYVRGRLDTIAMRHRFYVEPSLRALWKFTKNIRAELNYNLTTSRPELLNTLAYRDETNPLYITEGNPYLKDTHTHDASLDFSMMLSKQQLSLSATIDYKSSDRETRTALAYQPSTGIYTSRLENVPGSRSRTFRLNYDQGFGDIFRLQNDFRLTAKTDYAYLTQLTDDVAMTASKLNRLQQLNTIEHLTLSADWNWLKFSVYGQLCPNRLRYTESPEQNTTIWTNDIGLRGELTKGPFVITTAISNRMYSGYTISSMNRHLLLWDASVTWKVLKNKGHLRLELNDILNAEDNKRIIQSAYQQTVTRYDYRHHYLGISFTYHLDAKKT
ncbi:MAG: outer membrane beta-barrel protein [Bacteroidaceae bacterium]|nr:outer membrane beta-barrel protein [Bacteroidaceae bacterium]